jgi:hypothetical protein
MEDMYDRTNDWTSMIDLVRLRCLNDSRDVTLPCLLPVGSVGAERAGDLRSGPMSYPSCCRLGVDVRACSRVSLDEVMVASFPPGRRTTQRPVFRHASKNGCSARKPERSTIPGAGLMRPI